MRRDRFDPLEVPNYGFQEALQYLHVPNSTLHYWMRPLASLAKVQKNFPKTVPSEIRPPRAYRAAFVCGTPLPRASGKKRYRKYPMSAGPAMGTSSLRHAPPPAG